MKFLKRIIITLIPKLILTRYREFRNDQSEKQKYKLWLLNGCHYPTPEFYKRNRIHEIQKQSKIKNLIETGTFLGDMVFFNRKHFKKIVSIELSEQLYKNARFRFKEYKNITILHGDSGEIMPELVNIINAPTIFWLDGHYSSEFKGVQTAKGIKDCPILEELEPILKSSFNHIILIDDARMFKGENDYPTEKELINFIKTRRPNSKILLKNDIFEITITDEIHDNSSNI